MKIPIPTNAERCSINGETAWVWETKTGHSLIQGPYQIGLEHRLGRFTIDLVVLSPRAADFEGYLVQEGEEVIGRSVFLEYAADILKKIREMDCKWPN